MSLFDPGKKFLDPEKVLFAAGLGNAQTFADFGSGSGFYTLAGAQIVGERGQVYSIDILESALDHTSAEARLKNLRNIKTVVCDLEKPEACKEVPAGTVDMVLFANIIHQIKNRENLFAEAYRLLKTGGKLLVIEWNESRSPLGPPAEIRIKETDVIAVAKKTTLKSVGNISVDSYHYGLIFIK